VRTSGRRARAPRGEARVGEVVFRARAAARRERIRATGLPPSMAAPAGDAQKRQRIDGSRHRQLRNRQWRRRLRGVV